MKNYFLYTLICLFVGSCKPSNNPTTNILKHNYHVSNDSIEQSLELFSLGDSTAQFILRVENKYKDTLDSYMSHATSKDGKHFIHIREHCKITFEIVDDKKDTTIVNQCDCPELTVYPIKQAMTTDTAQIIVFR